MKVRRSCTSTAKSCSVVHLSYFHCKTLFSWSVPWGCKRRSRVRPYCEKGLHPFQLLLLCLSDDLTAFFSPTLAFQICYAFRSPSLFPVTLYCFCVPPISSYYFHLSSSTGDFPPEETEPDMTPPYQGLWNVGVCLMSVPYLLTSTPTFPLLHPSYISPGTAFYTCSPLFPAAIASYVVFYSQCGLFCISLSINSLLTFSSIFSLDSLTL